MTGGQAELEHELGDLLLAVSRYARKLGVEPEEALRKANRRFETRFGAVEERVRQSGHSVDAVGLDELDRLWREVKRDERSVPKK